MNRRIFFFLAVFPLAASFLSPFVFGEDKLVTPTEQATAISGARLAAPANARPPEDIDVDDLKPTLFSPIVKLLQQIQSRQEEAFERLEDLAASKDGDRADEILSAVQALADRKVTIKGWEENKAALDGLTGVLGKFRDRLERVATVDDVQEAFDSFEFPELPEPEPVDLSGVAREETLLAFGERFPTLENVREISANVASLTARLDELAAQLENAEVDEKIETLNARLDATLNILYIMLIVVAVLVSTVVVKLLIGMAAAAARFGKDFAAFRESQKSGSKA